jgi:hypothetical protein
LDGEALAQYCLWHRSLEQVEAEQWETLLSTLTPGARSLEKLNEFRFEHEPPASSGGKANDDLAAPVRGLIRANMTNE